MAARCVEQNDNEKAIQHCLQRVSDIGNESDKIRMSITAYNIMPLVSLEEAVRPLISILPSIQEYVYIAKQRCTKPPADGLTVDESASIMVYSMDWEPASECLYSALNETLRADDRKRLNPWFHYMKLFMTALSKLPASSRCVYRGVKDFTNDYATRKTISWWAFSSCTTSRKVLENEHFFGKTGMRTLFTIRCTSGKDISHHSYYQAEAEILLPAGSHFRVVAYDQKSPDLILIELEEIPSSERASESTSIVSTSRLSDIGNHNLTLQQRNVRSEILLQKRKLTDQDMERVIKQMIIPKQPTVLSLALNLISPEGVSILTDALFSNTSLEELNLAGNQILDTGVYSLSQALWANSSTLKILNLSCTGITDQGVEYLTNMLKENSTLTHLYLFQNNIADRGVELFSDVLTHHNATLEYLSLWENNLISDSCLDALMKISLSLKTFLVRSSNLSETANEQLSDCEK